MAFSFFHKKEKPELPDYWVRYENSLQGKLPERITDVKFVVLDTETTGFDYKTDRILCIGALVLKNNTIQVHKVLETFVEQEYYNKDAAAIHGILKKGIKQRIPELEALKEFLEYAEGAILVAHHAGFDLKMINAALERHQLPKLLNPVLDTSVMYKRTLLSSPLLAKKESYSLDELAEKYDISMADRHTALGDAYITAIAFLKIVHKLKLVKTKELFRTL